MKKAKERKLTAVEQKRKEEFKKLSERLMSEGYTPNHITMSVLDANIYGTLIAIPFALPILILFLIKGNVFTVEMWNFILAYVIVIALIVVHELIHGITWAAFVENGWKSISFGFIKEYLTPYCSCNQPMKKHQIIIGAFMPTLLLGIIPGVIAVLNGSTMLLIVALFMIFGGCGDLLVIFKLLCYRSKSKDTLYIDHPYEVGTAVFEKN